MQIPTQIIKLSFQEELYGVSMAASSSKVKPHLTHNHMEALVVALYAFKKHHDAGLLNLGNY